MSSQRALNIHAIGTHNAIATHNAIVTRDDIVSCSGTMRPQFTPWSCHLIAVLS